MQTFWHIQRTHSTVCVAALLVAAICATVTEVHAGSADQVSAMSQAELLARGAVIYKEQCASCHGAGGEGVAGDDGKYHEKLAGDMTTGELTRIIHDTMPDGEADQCVGEDARAVAEYIHYAFYSEAAQIRNRPPRIGLARLTASQLRQSIADLYAHFDGVPGVTEQQGVKAIYFNGQRWKNEEKKIERTDPVIDFDFGHESPGEGIEAKSFYIYWEGGLKADVTGRYEIVVRSTCSFVMDFGKIGRRLIDNHVQSGDKTEFRETLTLTAGRVYPFKIDFIQRDRKTELPPARISLSWVPLHGVEEIVPMQNLVPFAPQATFSLQTQLPPDDRSYGYERGIAVSREWDDSTTTAALEFAEIAVDELWPRYDRRMKDTPNENRARLRNFLKEVVETAFRGPLDDELRGLYIDQQVDATEDDAEAIKRVCLIALKSPRFLYPAADETQSVSRRAATRLTLTLFDSIPADQWLLKLASEDKLQQPDQIRAAANRMLKDYRVRGKTRDMLYAWLNLTQLHDISKDHERFPGYDEELIHDLRSSLNAFLDDVVWNGSGDLRQMFLADWGYTTDRMAAFYGDAWKPAEAEGARLRKTAGDPAARMGLINHPFLMSGLAYHDSSSPIHRGVFLIRYILGRTLRPPSEAFSPLSPDLHPDLTTRERVALQTSPDNCQMCHTKINGLGFVLENFDAVGRYQEQERGRVIDPSGMYIDSEDIRQNFAGPHDLARYLASSPDTSRAFVNRAFQHLVKQPPAAFGADTLEKLTEKFQQSGYNVRDLIVEIAVTAASEPLEEPLKEHLEKE